jgi:hypothetical protein
VRPKLPTLPMLLNRTLGALSSLTLAAAIALVAGVAGAAGAGCKPNEPPPARTPIPPPDARGARGTYTHENAGKPLPPQAGSGSDVAVAPPFYDEPIVSEQTPEEPRFVEAYNRVGRPRVTVFMNRTLDGQLMPVEHDTDWRNRDRDNWRNDNNNNEGYLRPGQYNAATARQIDYEEMESTLADWLSCSGQVVMISPALANQRLSDQQKGAMQSGQKQGLDDVAQSLNADVLVQVQAHPTQQSREGMKIRVIAEAMNTRGGQSLGRASVDMPVPMEKTDINNATRFLARKLMGQMTTVWNAPPPVDLRRDEPPTQPAPSGPATGARIPESGHDVTPSTVRSAPAAAPPVPVTTAPVTIPGP